MPQHITHILKMFPGDYYSFLNIGIVLCSFIESYIFPFALIKWVIVLTKYDGIVNLFKNRNSLKPGNSPIKRYSYSLDLMTQSPCRFKYNIENCNLSHVSVIMEFEADKSSICWSQLSYCGRDCQKIPPALSKMYGTKTHNLDLSYNCIETLKGLEQFTRLEELILDNNKLGDAVNYPNLPHLRTLSVNNNQISDLEVLISKISESFPSLTYLSLLSNKACPNQLSDLDKDESDYQRYRFYVVHRLPGLRFLDSRRISSSERREAEVRGEFMRVRRPQDEPDPPRPALPSARPLPVDFAALGKHKGAYGKCHYKYTGKHSEGNRFIRNSDL